MKSIAEFLKVGRDKELITRSMGMDSGTEVRI